MGPSRGGTHRIAVAVTAECALVPAQVGGAIAPRIPPPDGSKTAGGDPVARATTTRNIFDNSESAGTTEGIDRAIAARRATVGLRVGEKTLAA